MIHTFSHLRDSKLVRILKSLTPVEMNRLDKFIHSPFFCTDAKTIELFDYLKKIHPDFPDGKLDINILLGHLFPNEQEKKEGYLVKKLRLCNTYLLRHIYDFFRQTEGEVDEVFQQYYLLLNLHKRNISEDRDRLLKKSYKIANQINPKGERDFLDLFLLSDFEFTNQKGRFGVHDVEQSIHFLDQFYLTAKLKRFCLIFQFRRLNQEKFALASLHETMVYCKTYKFRTALAAIYFYMLQAFVQLEAQNFSKVIHAYRMGKRIKLKYLAHFEQGAILDSRIGSDVMTLFNQSIAISNALYRQGLGNYLYEMLGLYQEMLSYGLFQSDTEFVSHHYKNIVTLGLRLDKLNWTETFIEAYKDELPETQRQDVYYYNLAHLKLFQKEYRSTHKILNQIQFIDPFYNLGARVIHMKAYFGMFESQSDSIYELEEDFLRISKNFERYLIRETSLAQYQKKSYKNFIRFAKKLWRLKTETSDQTHMLKAQIEKSSPLIEKAWLLGQLAVVK